MRPTRSYVPPSSAEALCCPDIHRRYIATADVSQELIDTSTKWRGEAERRKRHYLVLLVTILTADALIIALYFCQRPGTFDVLNILPFVALSHVVQFLAFRENCIVGVSLYLRFRRTCSKIVKQSHLLCQWTVSTSSLGLLLEAFASQLYTVSHYSR